MKAFLILALTLMPTLNVWANSNSAESASEWDRCRDCPFPFKLSKNRWKLPDSNVILQIVEKPMTGGRIWMQVTLRNQAGTLLAEGSTQRFSSQYEIDLKLYDANGNAVRGEIVWVDIQDSVLRARFTCDDELCILPN